MPRLIKRPMVRKADSSKVQRHHEQFTTAVHFPIDIKAKVLIANKMAYVCLVDYSLRNDISC